MRRHSQLRGLSDDHHTALVVALRCKRATSGELGELWPAVQEAVAAHFEPHFAIEERLLLPALDGLGERDMAERIRDDHARLRSLAADPKPSLANVLEFGLRLEEHVRFEEREVFEQTQDRLPEPALAAIERACADAPRTCPARLVGGPA